MQKKYQFEIDPIITELRNRIKSHIETHKVSYQDISNSTNISKTTVYSFLKKPDRPYSENTISRLQKYIDNYQVPIPESSIFTFFQRKMGIENIAAIEQISKICGYYAFHRLCTYRPEVYVSKLHIFIREEDGIPWFKHYSVGEFIKKSDEKDIPASAKYNSYHEGFVLWNNGKIYLLEVSGKNIREIIFNVIDSRSGIYLHGILLTLTRFDKKTMTTKVFAEKHNCDDEESAEQKIDKITGYSDKEGHKEIMRFIDNTLDLSGLLLVQSM